jgi:hypothetical protein
MLTRLPDKKDFTSFREWVIGKEDKDRFFLVYSGKPEEIRILYERTRTVGIALMYVI